MFFISIISSHDHHSLKILSLPSLSSFFLQLSRVNSEPSYFPAKNNVPNIFFCSERGPYSAEGEAYPSNC